MYKTNNKRPAFDKWAWNTPLGFAKCDIKFWARWRTLWVQYIQSLLWWRILRQLLNMCLFVAPLVSESRTVVGSLSWLGPRRHRALLLLALEAAWVGELYRPPCCHKTATYNWHANRLSESQNARLMRRSAQRARHAHETRRHHWLLGCLQYKCPWLREHWIAHIINLSKWSWWSLPVHVACSHVWNFYLIMFVKMLQS